MDPQKPSAMVGTAEPPVMRELDFEKLRRIVYRQTGITIAEGRRSMMMSRLNKRLREIGLNSYKDYVTRVQSDPVEMQELTDRITTNETYFYRTPRIWSYFAEVLIPSFSDSGRHPPMRVWSAAASTGEEAHTMGIFLEEARQQQPRFDYSILGTDISSSVLATATEGLYRGRSVSRFQQEQPHLFATHMRGDEQKGWSVGPSIRSRLKFERHNLMQPLRGRPPFDVVFLRNVLIYFSESDQKTILSHVRHQMRPGGTLIIGESESLKHVATDFDQVEPIIYTPSAVAAGGLS